MRYKTMFLAFGVVVAALLMPSNKASAQPTSCIKDCMSCPWSPLRLQSDGLVVTRSAYSFMDACSSEWCTTCTIEGEGFASTMESPVDVLNALRRAAPADLSKLVNKYRTRLLLNEERGLLVVQGTACDKT